jgi:hypothetical protein
MSNLKVNDEWKNAGQVYVKINNDWKTVSESFVKVGGIWKRSTLGSPPEKPILEWHTTGQFKITNHDPSLHYLARFSDGPGLSGNASLNNSTGIYTLDGRNSAFFVSAAYAAGAPRSEEGYMERKARTTVRVQVGEECTPTGCVPNRVALCNEPPGSDTQCCRDCPAPSYDGQNRCICWRFGLPDPICFGAPDCRPIFRDVDDKKWANAPYFYTDRGSEWSKQS